MAIQLDFGGFDPAFLGVTLTFRTRTAWDTYQQFVASESPVSFASLPDPSRFEALSITSVISHEVRHFHDFLLSPYSIRVFRLRVQELLNVFQMLPQLLGDMSNSVPVPLPTWCRLDEGRRSERLARLPSRGDGQAWKPVPLPHFREEDIPEILKSSSVDNDDPKRLLLAGVQFREPLRQLTYNPRTVRGNQSFQPWQVFELSGLLVQLQELWQTQGSDQTQFFVNELQKFPNNPYSKMLNVAFAMWGSGHDLLDSKLTSAAVTWSLLGSYRRDGWNACPTERFARIWQLIAEKGVRKRDGDVSDLFEEWSSATDLSHVEDGLREAEELITELGHKLRKLLPRGTDTFAGKNLAEPLINVVQAVERSCRHMADQFRRNPWSYVSPEAYVNSGHTFVNPLLRFSFEESGLRLTTDRHALEKQVLWAKQDEAGEIIFSMIRPFDLSPFNFFDSQDVQYVLFAFGLVDFLFADRARTRSDVERSGRTFFRDSHVVPFDLLW